jgi:hypothetical protein
MLLSAHAYAADYQAASDDNIRFIALPYLHAFDMTENKPTITISPENRQNLTDYQWRISAISIPDYREQTGILQMIDTMQAPAPRLSAYGHIIVPLPERAAPLRVIYLAQQPLWVHMFTSGISRLTWHAPALTPVAAALAIAEQQRRARLAKRMADRAFYFGYDTNNDALK